MAAYDSLPIPKAETLLALVDEGASFTSYNQLRPIIKVGDILRSLRKKKRVDTLVQIGDFYADLYKFPNGRKISVH